MINLIKKTINLIYLIKLIIFIYMIYHLSYLCKTIYLNLSMELKIPYCERSAAQVALSPVHSSRNEPADPTLTIFDCLYLKKYL